MQYNNQIDWQINNMAKQELVKRWIDLAKLHISATKGIVHIQGELIFVGPAAADTEIPEMIMKLKAIERALRGLPFVRDIIWKLDNWTKSGLVWTPEKRAIRKKVTKLKYHDMEHDGG